MAAMEYAVMAAGLYKVCILLAGTALAYMGYRLFLSGVFENATELKGVWGENGLILKQAAPGIFFALFGTVVMVVGLWRGLDFQIEQGANSLSSGTSSSPTTAQTKDASASKSGDNEKVRSKIQIQLHPSE